MRVLIGAQSKVVQFEYPDDTDFIVDRNHNLLELTPKGGQRSFFNMQYLIALVPSETKHE